MARKTRHEPIPLTRWIRGQIHVHFRSGHVATLRTSLHSAHSVRLQADDAEGGESIDGLESHEGWIAARSEEIVLTDWTPEPDYGWRDTSPEDRDRLKSLGMKHGILCALADLWADRGGQPSFSIAAVSALFVMATQEDVTRAQWDRIAEMAEGEDGARVVASVWETLTGVDVPSHLVDDSAEPEPAPHEDESEEVEGSATTTADVGTNGVSTDDAEPAG